MNNERIVIVDYNHLVHQYYMGGAPRLFYTINMNGRPVQIETTIPAYTIKGMHAYARHGRDRLAVCFDSPCNFRKKYFAVTPDGKGTGIDYKGGRPKMINSMFEGCNLTVDILSKTDVPIYKCENYEADDLVYSLVMICKELFPNNPIDVVCNDADLLPLVDEQVSVFFRSRKLTWAESKDIEKRNYWQVTPDNYEEVVGGLSKYKKFDMRYNTLLLHKLLRGDDSDGIPGLIDPNTNRADFPPKMYNELIRLLDENMEDLEKVFRYAYFEPKKARANCNDNTSLAELFKQEMEYNLSKIVYVLSSYVDDNTLDHIKFIYRGMCPRFINLVPPEHYKAGVLQAETSKLGINIKII